MSPRVLTDREVVTISVADKVRVVRTVMAVWLCPEPRIVPRSLVSQQSIANSEHDPEYIRTLCVLKC